MIRQLKNTQIHWIVQLFGNKVIGRFSLTSQTEYAN